MKHTGGNTQLPSTAGDADITIESTVHRIVFSNPANGYTVARLIPYGGGDEFVAVGTFLNLTENSIINVTGHWETHQKFGRQFKVASYTADLPRSAMGIRKFLESRIKGVGQVMAKRIVDHFGEDTVDIIDNSPQRLREVEGLGAHKIKSILESWQEHRKSSAIMMFLHSYGIGPGTAQKIFNTYGDSAIDVLKSNPYILASDIYGIGFKIADRIAMSLGIEKDSPQRLQAGIVYTVETSGNDGHVFLPRELLVDTAASMLECDNSTVSATLDSMLASSQNLVAIDDRIYTARLEYAERKIAERIAKILTHIDEEHPPVTYTPQDVDNIATGLGFELSPLQLSTVDLLSEGKIVILTGGPGTGKTASTRAVIQLFKNHAYHVELAAPTGRAAKRMTEATGWPSRTIHRLLEYNPIRNSFLRDEDNPIDADLIVLDEMSMIDVMLMYHLLKAVKYNTRILLVGDVDQLPSVGPGNVLRDLIASEVIPCVRLDTVYRQGSENTIVANAHLINSGKIPIPARDRSGDFFFFENDDPDSSLDLIVNLCRDRIPNAFGIDSLTGIQVISPMYRTTLGVDNLNKVLRETLNPKNRDVQCGSSRLYRIDDRVMQIKNNYEKEIFNGDVGFIRDFNLGEGSLTVEFPEHFVNYSFSELDQLVLAYAITVHKSQGSEYPAVVIPMSTQHFTMLQRNLLYTAITRASKIAVIVGTRRAVAIAVGNNKIEQRFTSLAERLQDMTRR